MRKKFSGKSYKYKECLFFCEWFHEHLFLIRDFDNLELDIWSHVSVFD